VLLYRLAPDVDPILEAGKRRNVALAAPAFDGLVLSPQQPLSFWRTLGRVRAEAGYAVGRELAGGCVVPALGGGLCLLSNAIFALAALSGWRIVERHAHSRGVGRAEPDDDGLDATVFWPHLDLVVAPRHGAARLSVRVQGDRLRLEAWGTAPADTVRVWPEAEGEVAGPDGPMRQGTLWRSISDAKGQVVESKENIGEFRQRLTAPAKVERSCFTCGETECHARAKNLAGPRA
jgi:vancomycin resistance protein VanW